MDSSKGLLIKMSQTEGHGCPIRLPEQAAGAGPRGLHGCQKGVGSSLTLKGALQILPGAILVSTSDGFFIFIYLLFSAGVEGKLALYMADKHCTPGLSSQLRGH